MADETAKLKTKLAALSKSLDGLESALEPLLSQSLPETVLGLDTIQQAKLQVAIPYVVYDLVFVYLKTRGIDPKTHPVIAELDRIRQYFDKIKNAENPEKRQLAVDKAAATRFIKHAITQAQSSAPVAGPSTHVKFDEQGTPHDVRPPVVVTSKMLEREQYHKNLKEADSDDEDADLDVIDGEDDEKASQSSSSSSKKGKGKASNDVPPPEESRSGISGKRRRHAVDPFAGYGDDIAASDPGFPSSSAKRTKTAAVEHSGENESGTSTPSSATPAGSQTKAKKASKKKRKSTS
ncbi:C1D-domain-containing protein [Dentipellis sp. KUC8613]|nr:C1D-domain-containing protein [Dentipellis sp. KUC8613]